jgi:hypothetical protein
MAGKKLNEPIFICVYLWLRILGGCPIITLTLLDNRALRQSTCADSFLCEKQDSHVA